MTYRERQTQAIARKALALAEHVLAVAMVERERREDLERRVAELEKARAARTERVAAATAARRLGISLASIRRLIQSGDLAGAALRLPDRERRVWVVEAQALARFERDAGAVGATGTTNRLAAGPRAQGKRG